jgi:hypothetical protein
MESKRGCPTLGLGGWVLGSISPLGVRDARWAKTHLWPARHLHFIAFSCYRRRLPLLKTVRARDVFVRELARVRADYEFLLVGYVVTPEHVHPLISYRYRPGMKKSREKPKTHPPNPRVGRPTWSVWLMPGPPAP